MGTLQFTKVTRDTTIDVRVHVDRAIAEHEPDNRSARCHLLSVFGNDQEIAAIAAALSEEARFYLTGPQIERLMVSVGALLQLAEDVSAPQIAKAIPLTPQPIRRLGHRYQRAGLEGALYEKQRPGAAELLDNNQRQRIIAWCAPTRPRAAAAGRSG